MLNGHLSDQVAQGYCTAQPKVQVTNNGSGFEAQIRSLDVPGVVGHIREDRRMWFTADSGGEGGGGSGDGGGAASVKGPLAPSKGQQRQRHRQRRHLRQ